LNEVHELLGHEPLRAPAVVLFLQLQLQNCTHDGGV
jgi:hypothetical protein